MSNDLYPQRKSPRANFHDYSNGDYFITICTADRQHYFGEITHGIMHYTAVGTYCLEQLQAVESHYPYASCSLFVVMPNHIHAIIHIRELTEVTSRSNRTHRPCVPTVRTVLSVVVGGIKRSVTLFAHRNNIEFGWQSRFHDHIIRGVHDGNRIVEYINNNVQNWASDCFHPSS